MPKDNLDKTCIDCVHFTWNWHKMSKCIGSGDSSIKPCIRFEQIEPKEAKKRLKVLGTPGVY